MIRPIADIFTEKQNIVWHCYSISYYLIIVSGILIFLSRTEKKPDGLDLLLFERVAIEMI